MHGTILSAFILLVFAVLPQAGSARDLDGRYAQMDPRIKAWVRELTDRNGVNCCDFADGFPAEEVEWHVGDKGYSVVIEGQRVPVPPSALRDDIPNKLMRAMVWWVRQADGSILIRCFLPGATI